jgi:hypothetical protein
MAAVGVSVVEIQPISPPPNGTSARLLYGEPVNDRTPRETAPDGSNRASGAWSQGVLDAPRRSHTSPQPWTDLGHALYVPVAEHNAALCSWSWAGVLRLGEPILAQSFLDAPSGGASDALAASMCSRLV